MADRLAVLDGSMTVDSAPGSGTTVTGSLPGSIADAMVNGASSAGIASSESAGAGIR
jgi:chemotaxis protein histidine kinase CheA